MGRIQNSDCQVMTGTFFERLASCARIDPDTGDIFINIICYEVDCEDDPESPFACEMNITDHEQWCADNFFALDDCDHLALKLNYCGKTIPDQK